jgi:hypothetical protein
MQTINLIRRGLVGFGISAWRGRRGSAEEPECSFTSTTTRFTTKRFALYTFGHAAVRERVAGGLLIVSTPLAPLSSAGQEALQTSSIGPLLVIPSEAGVSQPSLGAPLNHSRRLSTWSGSASVTSLTSSGLSSRSAQVNAPPGEVPPTSGAQRGARPTTYNGRVRTTPKIPFAHV